MSNFYTETSIGRALMLKKHPVRADNLTLKIGRTIIVVICVRGGVGKTTTTINLAETLISAGCKVRVETTDTGNSDTIMAGLSTAAAIDLATAKGQDAFVNLFANLASETADHVVVDTGAGPVAEHFFAPRIAMLSEFAREAGFTLVIVRPITTSHVTQVHTKAFIEKVKPANTACIVVRNMSGPRFEEDYARRTNNEEIKALKNRFIQVDLLPIRAVVLDNMLSFRMSPSKILYGEIERAGKKAEVAEAIFTTAIRLAVGEWLLTQQSMFEHALIRAIDQVKDTSNG
jgi:MinD-like ATPase involved in chromosome partitioning or flagellar assembly